MAKLNEFTFDEDGMWHDCGWHKWAHDLSVANEYAKNHDCEEYKKELEERRRNYKPSPMDTMMQSVYDKTLYDQLTSKTVTFPYETL